MSVIGRSGSPGSVGHQRDRQPAGVLRRTLRADGRLAGQTRSRRHPRRARTPDPRLHGHHARLARPRV